jgi:HEAT repeat protein
MIVDILYKIPSPQAVPFLAEASLRKYDYDSYAEFAVKCLEALAVINTPEAWAAIEAALGSSSDRVRERARELIDYR